MRCPNCQTKVVRFPIKDNNGKLIIKNLFKMDIMSVIWFVVLILLIVTYKADIKTCEEIITKPLTYCEDSGACKIIEERKEDNLYGVLIDIKNIPEINVTG